MPHVVVGSSGKLLAGHDGKMSLQQAETRAEQANEKAEKLGLEARYATAVLNKTQLKELTR